ncbi:MAG: ATP-dependent helicase [Candidatus Omnitrophica bacterium]|nr:ATP-dependent helicase [Candidatus Omnitrophota bacterium]MBU1133888.1 ATP-dependent helicase [Candidatus Omnitrophota bacterium]
MDIFFSNLYGKIFEMETYKLTPFSYKSIIDYKENLNYQQLKAVEETEGHCLVLAGAGSGKTRVLIYRLAYLLEKGNNPENILLATFTNKAAREMINRSECLLKSSISGLWVGTFHHIGNLILRKEAAACGYSPNFTIVDREDAKDLIEDCLEELGFLKQDKLFPKKNIISNIQSLAVNSQKELDEVVASFYSHIEEYTPGIKRVLNFYKKKKKESNVMDFDDLLFNWLKILQDKDLCAKYSKNFKYILVDEYQDTNRLQFEILKALASVHKNILAVGDDAQSIYSFRAAQIDNLLNFPKIFSSTKIFKLQINYRSSPQILSFANEIIAHNVNQFPKTLEAIKKDGELPVVVKTNDVYQQAKFVAQRVLELNKEGVPLEEMAVLFRSRFQSLELEMELLKRNIPYIVRGGVRFFEQAHIKDVLAYLKVINNSKDELSFKRAISLYKGIGKNFAYKIWAKLIKEKKTTEEIEKKLPARQKQGFKEFFLLLRSLKETQKPQEAIQEILKFYKDYCYLSFDNPQERILDLEELAKMAANYPTIRRFLLDLNSVEDFKGETLISPAQKEEMLVLSTIHQAKGLEWEVVYLIGFSDYEFPHPKALNSAKALEEERRLFYVATTRAKSYLYVTYPQTKYTFKNGLIISRPSMFLDELPSNCYQEWNLQDNASHLL